MKTHSEELGISDSSDFDLEQQRVCSWLVKWVALALWGDDRKGCWGLLRSSFFLLFFWEFFGGKGEDWILIGWVISKSTNFYVQRRKIGF